MNMKVKKNLLYDQENDSGISFPRNSSNHLFTSAYTQFKNTSDTQYIGIVKFKIRRWKQTNLAVEHHSWRDDGLELDEGVRYAPFD